MEVIPAVDIMGGKVVRLSKGEPLTAKTYEGFEDPLQVARRWESEGAAYLHVVDLDAAIGRGDNRKVISTIIRGVNIPVQVGGGIRSRVVAEEMLAIGASRVIVATLAFEREDILKMLIKRLGCERIMVALDYIKDVVMVEGWRYSTGLTLINAMKKFSSLEVTLFLLTSISRDGLLMGPDYATLKDVARRFKRGIFVAGGVTSRDDLARLKSIDIDGVVVGKALYERRLNLREALDVVRK